MSDPIQIVGVRFLNARPLLAGLEAGVPAPFSYRFTSAEPAECADELARGRVGAGLVPVAALPMMARIRALPSLGVVARHEVRSVLLISRVPLSRVRRLAAHTASRTSVVLARLLLAERWGVTPEVIPARPPLEEMLADADAAVLIGDPALLVHGRTGLLEIDLAAAWVEWTSLPFVFAVWGVHRTAPPGLGDLFMSSLAFAEARWEELLPTWAVSHGVGLEETRSYLSEALSFRLGDAERAGVVEFLARAGVAGLVRAPGEVWSGE
jgi:chorismate dehydratase